jgi:phospholipase D1/2
MHPAKVGFLPRLLLWPRTAKEMRKNLAQVNEEPLVERQAFLKRAPRLAPLLTWKNDQLVPRAFPPPLVPVTHHQKLAVFDNERLYIGGLDLNDRRYDTPTHQQDAPDTWHDTQVLVDGPVAQEAADHLRSFMRTASGALPLSQNLLLRTISAKRRVSFPFLSPKSVVRTLAAAHTEQIAKSQTLIYLETQFFRDRGLARQLAERASQNPALSLILILPAAPEDAAFDDEPGSDVAYGEHLQAKCIKILRDAFGARVFAGSPAQPRAVPPDGRATHYGAPIVYLHAKVSIFDDRRGIISSANLNGRSFAWDTEAGISTQNAAELEQLKSRCFAHWLGPTADPACYNTKTACDAWSKQAARNVQMRPEDRSGLILPYSLAEAEALGHNLPGVPDEMV